MIVALGNRSTVSVEPWLVCVCVCSVRVRACVCMCVRVVRVCVQACACVSVTHLHKFSKRLIQLTFSEWQYTPGYQRFGVCQSVLFISEFDRGIR